MAFEEASSEGLKENHKKILLDTRGKGVLVMYWQKFSNTIAWSQVKCRKWYLVCWMILLGRFLNKFRRGHLVSLPLSKIWKETDKLKEGLLNKRKSELASFENV